MKPDGGRHIEIETPGVFTICQQYGLRIYNSSGRELAAIDGPESFWRQLAKEAGKMAAHRASERFFGGGSNK
jgi:hypothetical protein